MNTRSNRGRFRTGAMIAFLMQAPRTVRQLTKLVNGLDNPSAGAMENVKRWLNAWHDLGVVYIADFERTRTHPAAMYALQPKLFHHPDAVFFTKESQPRQAKEKELESIHSPRRIVHSSDSGKVTVQKHDGSRGSKSRGHLRNSVFDVRAYGGEGIFGSSTSGDGC